jgi:hypothetical protein
MGGEPVDVETLSRPPTSPIAPRHTLLHSLHDLNAEQRQSQGERAGRQLA